MRNGSSKLRATPPCRGGGCSQLPVLHCARARAAPWDMRVCPPTSGTPPRWGPLRCPPRQSTDVRPASPRRSQSRGLLADSRQPRGAACAVLAHGKLHTPHVLVAWHGCAPSGHRAPLSHESVSSESGLHVEPVGHSACAKLTPSAGEVALHTRMQAFGASGAVAEPLAPATARRAPLVMHASQ
jgi:hypothetical protein